METQAAYQQQPPLLPHAEPGQMAHQPRLDVDPGLLAQMRSAAGLTPTATQIQPRIAQGQKDWSPLYAGLGFLGLLMICGTTMYGISNGTNPQTERVATEAIQGMALVGKATAERPTCQVVALIAMRGTCPEQDEQPVDGGGAIAPEPQYQPVQDGAIASNPYAGWTFDQLKAEWDYLGCVDTNVPACANLVAANTQ